MRSPGSFRTWMQVFFLIAIILTGCGFPSPAKPEPDLITPGIPALKLVVDEPGIYRIKGVELQEAGFVVDQKSGLQVSTRGNPVPTWIEGSGDDFLLIFYGTPAESQYTKRNIYWLKQEAQQAPPSLKEISTAPSSAFQAGKPGYLTRLVLEEKNIFSPFILDDPWYWMAIPAPGKQTLELEIGEVDSEAAQLSLLVWGVTKSPEPNDHHLRVLINDVIVLDEWWDGAGAYQLTADIPPGILHSGMNAIVLDAPGDTGAIADNVFLQRLEILYHRLDASEGQVFLLGEGETVDISGFGRSVEVFDVTHPDRPVRLTLANSSDDRTQFIAEKDRQYLFVVDQGYLEPGIETPASIPDLMGSTTGADYLVVGPARLLVALEPLLALRLEQGITSLVVPLEAVYDQFNHGLPEPEAIHQLVLHADAEWQIKPRYLLLVGDASYDPKGYLAEPEANQLPIYFIDTQYGGLTGSDLPYADLDGDQVPDMAVGRVPARTSAEVEAWVKKTLAYENKLSDLTPPKALAVADGQEAAFSEDGRSFLDALSGSYKGELYAPPADVADASVQISRYFEAGYHLVGYFGHGSLNMWGRDRLFSDEDVFALKQDRYPVVLTMTCLNGFFIHPTTPSLAEALLFAPGGGAVAVLAPTSLTTAWDQKSFGENLYLGIAEPGDRRLGDIMLEAQQKMPLNFAGQIDVVMTFLLFGDPALALPHP